MTEFIKVGLSMDYDYKHGSQKHQHGQVGSQCSEMLKVRASLEEKLMQKGIYKLMTPKSVGTHKHSLQNVNGRLETFADFDDEVAEAGKVHGMAIGQTKSSNLIKLSQLVAVKQNMPMWTVLRLYWILKDRSGTLGWEILEKMHQGKYMIYQQGCKKGREISRRNLLQAVWMLRNSKWDKGI